MLPCGPNAVANCMVVTAKPIRVQLPGSAMYAPAMREAAAKIAARSGLSKRRAKTFEDLVGASVDLLVSGNASMITLEMTVHEDELSAKLTGKGCKSPTKKLSAALNKLAEAKSRAFERKATKTALTITFSV